MKEDSSKAFFVVCTIVALGIVAYVVFTGEYPGDAVVGWLFGDF